MRVEILTLQFKKALSICERITRKTTTLPALQNVLIEAKGNFLELTTTNLETTIKWWVLAKVEKAGELAVPATFLSNLISLIETEKITLSTDNDNLIINAPEQENQIQTQDIEDFPIIPKIEKNKTFILPAKQLLDSLAQVIDIPSISQIRPEISGVYFSFKSNQLKIAATDSFLLGEKTIKLEKPTQEEASFILPQGTARELLNALSLLEEREVVICPSKNQILFEFQNENKQPKIQILSRLIEGRYPDYQAIIPKTHQAVIRIPKEKLENQIKKAGLFSGKVLEVKLSTLPKESKLKVFAQSQGTGRNQSFTSADIKGEAIEASFNHKFLTDGLNKIRSSEVLFQLSSSDGPGVLRPVGDDTYFYILMPIKAT